MTLAIHLPTSSITIDSDNIDNLNNLSDFCKTDLGAYHPKEDVNELVIDNLSEEMFNKFYSLIFRLGFI